MPKRKTSKTMPTASNGDANPKVTVANGRSPARTVDKLEAFGADRILDRITDGDSIRKIASDIGVPHSALLGYIDRSIPPDLYTRARQESAESWADLGWECLQLEGDEIDSARVNLARSKEGYCRWRAGIANPRYSEKQSIELTGANGGPVQSLVTVYVPANGREERVIDVE